MKKYAFVVTGFVLLSVAFLVQYLTYTAPSTVGVSQLSGPEFLTSLAQKPDAVVLDVRTPEEFASGHIDTAININFNDESFLSEIAKLDPQKSYFMYCRSGNRTGKAIAAMIPLGFTHITELKGGVSQYPEVLTQKRQFPEGVTSQTNAHNLSDSEKAGLVYMREEEKLARDVYTTLGNQWAMPIFKNIASSEQTHMDAVKNLLARYEIVDPVEIDIPNKFQDPELQKLYSTLTEKGAASLNEALTVGALIEDLDISDLQKYSALTAHNDVITVYENLAKGSRNHLRAFTAQLQANGGSYTPSHISEAEYQAIVGTPQERGGMGGMMRR